MSRLRSVANIAASVSILTFAAMSMAQPCENDPEDYYSPNLQSQEALSNKPELVSLLDSFAFVEGFGHIAYREPRAGNTGPAMVLLPAVYGGTSHRAYREIAPLLDDLGYRVFLLDLPGTGASDKPKRRYDFEVADEFIIKFLETVSNTPVTLVAANTITPSALQVAGQRPDLVNKVVLLSPVGVNTIATPPNIAQRALYENLLDCNQVDPYIDLLTEDSARFFFRFTYFDDSLINDALIEEVRLQQFNVDQRWATYAFVAGQFFRSFEDASADVTQPVLALFGREAEAFGDAGIERPEDFAAIRPDFRYVEVPQSGISMWRERPAVTAAIIRRFVGL